jgi:hypothetical protein
MCVKCKRKAWNLKNMLGFVYMKMKDDGYQLVWNMAKLILNVHVDKRYGNFSVTCFEWIREYECKVS